MDDDARYRALEARDARFDGVFFVGVTTTGIYCRPVCRARLAARDRCRFFDRAAQAEHAGFRACFRCRPELAPGAASVDAVSSLARVAAARIEAGALNDGTLDDLASDLGVSERHLRRAVLREVGVAPVELAQSCRLALAKKLLQDSAMPIVEIAYASGFGSVRRLNAAFRERFGRPPSVVKRERAVHARTEAIPLKLGFRAPLAWREMLAFLSARAIPGVERVDMQALRYERAVALGEARGNITVTTDMAARVVRVEASPSLARCLMDVAARVRALFDLDADSLAIDAYLRRDSLLGRRVRARPGLRVPGAFDGFEVAVRAIVGQQITVAGATRLMGRVVAVLGALDAPAVLRAGEGALGSAGLTRVRARAVWAVAEAVVAKRVVLVRGANPEQTMMALEQIPGIGPWTAKYIVMRALGAPDVLPSGDRGLTRALNTTSRALDTRGAQWSPWRAYAAMHVWQG
jgi:AraC family transcriptional regulator of adaptative response / DNA-3-methyladenine glycosylase II